MHRPTNTHLHKIKLDQNIGRWRKHDSILLQDNLRSVHTFCLSLTHTHKAKLLSLRHRNIEIGTRGKHLKHLLLQLKETRTPFVLADTHTHTPGNEKLQGGYIFATKLIQFSHFVTI